MNDIIWINHMLIEGLHAVSKGTVGPGVINRSVKTPFSYSWQ